MPRIRSIKPQFWIDEDLGNISRDARLLYIGLWNISDDGGVFEWRTGRIKNYLFPNDLDVKAENIENWLEELVNIGDIKKFSKNGSDYGYIPSLLKHQDIYKPSTWRYATPPKEYITLPLPYQYPTTLPPVGDEYPTTQKSPHKEKEKYISSSNVENSSLLVGDCFVLFEQNFQKITDKNAQIINDLIETYGVSQVYNAMEIAIRRNKRNLAYVEGILKNPEKKPHEQRSKYKRVN